LGSYYLGKFKLRPLFYDYLFYACPIAPVLSAGAFGGAKPGSPGLTAP